jgi:hypothetical protein
MYEIFNNLFDISVLEYEKLSGGYSFETWLLKLEDGEKVIFRTGENREVKDGKKANVSDVFSREEFFYNTVNSNFPGVSPEKKNR